MGRYDGEDYSAEHYARQAADEAQASNLGLIALVLRLRPSLRHMYALLDLGRAAYGGFSSAEARVALCLAGHEDEQALGFLNEWADLGFFSVYRTPFRPDLPEGAMHLTSNAKLIAEAVRDRRVVADAEGTVEEPAEIEGR